MRPEENHIRSSPIPSTYPPRDVLENFVRELRSPIRTIEDLLPPLFAITKLEEGREIFPQLTQALLMTNQSIALVLQYLHARLRNSIANTNDMAESILAEFTHELREASAPLAGYVAACERLDLSEDRLAHLIKKIEIFGKILPEVFKALEENWQIWLEPGDFDRDRMICHCVDPTNNGLQ